MTFSVVVGGIYGVHRMVNNELTVSDKEQILDAYSEYFADYDGIYELTDYPKSDEDLYQPYYNGVVIKQNGAPSYIMAYAFPNADIKVWSYNDGNIFDLVLKLDYIGYDETVTECMTSENQEELLIVKYSKSSDSDTVDSINDACIWKITKSDDGLKNAGKYIFNSYNG